MITSRTTSLRMLSALLVVIALLLSACSTSGDSDAVGSEDTGSTEDDSGTEPAGGEATEDGQDDDQMSADDAEPVRIAFLTGVLANPYVQASIAEMEEVAAELNAELTVVDANFDAQKQFGDMQDAIASQQYDAIVLLPLDGNALGPLVAEANEAGIVVGSTDLPLGPDNTTTAVQFPGISVSVLRPFSAHGQNMGELTVDACEGDDDCNVAVVLGSKALPADQTILEFFTDAISGHDNIEIVAEGEGGYSRDGGLAAAQDILQANPDLDVWVSVDQSAIGAEGAIEDAGLTDQIKIIGYGGTEQAIQAIRDGRWFGNSVSLPRTEGRIVMEGVIEAVRSGTEVGGTDAVAEAGVPNNGKITAENVDQFEAEYEG